MGGNKSINSKTCACRSGSRYDRQVLFYPIGKAGQDRLAAGSVTIIGCGGLGSVSASNLARVGIGSLRLVDRDEVDFSNLGRQVLYDEADARQSRPKALAAKQKLSLINSGISVEAFNEEINPVNIGKFIEGADLVIDGSDNLQTRFIINEACVNKKIPWIYGSVAASYGMAASIIPGKTPCFSCIFGPSATKYNIYSESSANAGILNTAVNVIASVQCTEAIKYLTGNIDAVIRGLIIFDIWELSLEIVSTEEGKGRAACPVCGYNAADSMLRTQRKFGPGSAS